MGYFDDEEGVESYVKMAEGYEGTELVRAFATYLEAGASVLELGMGPGKDLALLADAGLRPTGSDSSEAFLRHYRKHGGTLPTACLDARTIETDERFDAIYSNKVLHHLTATDLEASLDRQRGVVRPGGLLFHSFWHGDRVEEHHGLLFTYYTLDTLRAVVPDGLVEVTAQRYEEMEPDDSFWVLWRVTG